MAGRQNSDSRQILVRFGALPLVSTWASLFLGAPDHPTALGVTTEHFRLCHATVTPTLLAIPGAVSRAGGANVMQLDS